MLPYPVSISTRNSPSVPRSSLKVCNPLHPGSFRSSTAASGTHPPTASIASSPEPTATTSYPRDRIARASRSRYTGSSSTSRIL